MVARKSARRQSMQHPDHTEELPRLKRIIGQLEGVKRMVEDRRYCPDIIQQLRAANSAIKALEIEILKGHLGSCIRDSAKSDSKSDFDAKLEELLNIIKT